MLDCRKKTLEPCLLNKMDDEAFFESDHNCSLSPMYFKLFEGKAKRTKLDNGSDNKVGYAYGVSINHSLEKSGFGFEKNMKAIRDDVYSNYPNFLSLSLTTFDNEASSSGVGSAHGYSGSADIGIASSSSSGSPDVAVASSSSSGLAAPSNVGFEIAWPIIKKLKSSDSNGIQCRLLIERKMAKEHIIPYLSEVQRFEAGTKEGTVVTVRDCDDGVSEHKLTFARWSTGSYIFKGGWRKEFASRRGLKENDEIGLRYDVDNGVLLFSVLSRFHS